MINLNIYFHPDDPKFNEIKEMIEELKSSYSFNTSLIDVSQDEALLMTYKGRTPLIKIGPYTLNSPFTIQDIKVTLGAAMDRSTHLEKIDEPAYKKRLKRGQNLSHADKISYWLSQHYMLVINLFLLVFVGLPFLAPVLVHNGWSRPAEVIYAIYKPLCHQLPYRSWFLYGEQPYYPRELAGIPNVASYESFIGNDPYKLSDVRQYIGNEPFGFGDGQVGYKVALCQRDTAIYLGLFLFGLLFSLTKRKIKPLPWYLWLVLGLVPIGLDGVSQLPGIISILPDWLLMRESTPVIRVITGALFGITTAWYLFPLIEENMVYTRVFLAGKIASLTQND